MKTRYQTIACLTALTVLLLLTFSQVFVSRAYAFSQNSECYGETLELHLVQGVEREPTGIWLILPYTDIWIVYVGRSQNLRDLPCAEGPVEAYSAVSPVTHRILTGSAREALEKEGALLTTLKFSTISSEAMPSYRKSQKYWWDNVYSKASRTPGGHVRRPSVDNDAVGGSWLLSEAYPDPTGDRIPVGCALVCRFSYRLSENFRLTYQVSVADKTVTPDWISIDRAVRSVVKGWIEGEIE